MEAAARAEALTQKYATPVVGSAPTSAALKVSFP